VLVVSGVVYFPCVFIDDHEGEFFFLYLAHIYLRVVLVTQELG
jgi:hypothetical protein